MKSTNAKHLATVVDHQAPKKLGDIFKAKRKAAAILRAEILELALAFGKASAAYGDAWQVWADANPGSPHDGPAWEADVVPVIQLMHVAETALRLASRRSYDGATRTFDRSNTEGLLEESIRIAVSK